MDIERVGSLRKAHLDRPVFGPGAVKEQRMRPACVRTGTEEFFDELFGIIPYAGRNDRRFRKRNILFQSA
jgi:hypothetical protein